MENLLTLTLIARNDERNHHRRYTVTVGRDLLDDWTVDISFGRAGHRGRVLRYADADPARMMVVIRDHLKRRLSAPKRIGCAYRLAEISAAQDFEAGKWLPGDIMDGFSGLVPCSSVSS